jgi:hypothetical protein
LNAVRAVLAELLALFVDDWNFTAAIMAWLVVVTLMLPRFLPDSSWGGPVLFLGSALVLACSTWRRARPPA